MDDVNLENILVTLNKLGIECKLVGHEPVFTVDESKAKSTDDGETIVKNMLLKSKDKQFFLVIVHGEQRLDLKALATKLCSKKLSFANADELSQLMGVEPGAVSLFCLLRNDARSVHLVIDESLFLERLIGFHPLDNSKTILISGVDVRNFIDRLTNKLHLI